MREIDNLLKKRNPDYGGVGALITGEPGCGKSNALAKIAFEDFKKGNVVVWRSKTTCQWTILTHITDKLHFWFKKGLKFRLYDKNKQRYSSFKYYGIVSEYETSDELVANLSRDRINIIQTIPCSAKSNAQQRAFMREWIEIIDEMIKRHFTEDITIIYDEFEDLAPEGRSGCFHLTSHIGNLQKELRKHDIHFFGATHRVTEIFYKVTNKIPWMVYMKGSVPKRGSRLYVKKLIKLKCGQAIVENQTWDDFTFSFIGKAKKLTSEVEIPKENTIKYKKEDEKEKELQEMKKQNSYS